MNCISPAASRPVWTHMLPIIVLASLASGAAGQQRFGESFDVIGPDLGAGPSNLVAAGWTFVQRAQGSVTHAPWRAGPVYQGFSPLPKQGGAYIEGEVDIGGFGNNRMSSWMVLPAVTGQMAGDQLSVWVHGFSNLVELRYSPTGGTNVGGTPDDVGDFTDVLSSRFPPLSWQSMAAPVPGNGRLAIRWYGTANSPTGYNLRVDDLRIDANPAVPYPAAGQTVHWTPAMSPIVVSNGAEVVSGGTVIIDPGVVVSLPAAGLLSVNGTLLGQGMPFDPITFTSPGGSATLGGQGSTSLSWATVRAHVLPGLQGSVEFYDCTFQSGSIIGNQFGGYGWGRSIWVFDGCAFEVGSIIGIYGGQIALRNCSIAQSAGDASPILHGYCMLDNVSVSSGGLAISGPDALQPMLIENVSVVGNSGFTPRLGAGLELGGGRDFLIGSNVIIQGNDVPVAFGFNGGGLLPGSVVPATGNLNDWVWDTEDTNPQPGHVVSFAKLDVPYVLSNFRRSPPIAFEPGARVLWEGASGGIEFIGDTQLEGLPSDPIVFGALTPGMRGQGLGGLDDLRAEYCSISETTRALSGRPATYISNCDFNGSRAAVSGVQSGVLFASDCRFVDNDTGIYLSSGGVALVDNLLSPNSFTGNGLAIEADALGFPPSGQAKNCWWGDPSGPTHPSNPGGTGDTVGGLYSGNVTVLPFLAENPIATNHPPVVRLEARNATLDGGQKLIFDWSVFDDVAVVEQRLMLASNVNTQGAFTQIADLEVGLQSFEWTAPPADMRAQQTYYLRVEAIDNTGKVGWDELRVYVPADTYQGAVSLLSPLASSYEPGDSLTSICFSNNTAGPINSALLVLDADEASVSSAVYSNCILSLKVPSVSTDTARLMVRVPGADHYVLSNYFSIRPDPRLGDAPPTVTMIAPAEGQSLPGGRTVSIHWTASDDEGLRWFKIQASLDGGKFWSTVESQIPGTARSYKWRIPKSVGIPDVRLRVVAIDHRFQNSSDTRSVRILPDMSHGSRTAITPKGPPSPLR